MMTAVKTILLATTLAAFGSSAFAEEIRGEQAEDIVLDGEIITSSIKDGDITVLLVGYRSKLFYCHITVRGDSSLSIVCYSR